MEKQEDKKKKVFRKVEIIALSVVVLVYVFCLVMELAAPDLAFSQWMKNVWDVKATLLSLKDQVPIIIKDLLYIVIIYAVCKLLRIFFHKRMEKNNRKKTIYTLLDGFIKYACAIAIIIFILNAVGVDTAAVLASVGVLTLVVGLGAQPLIADIIAGIFIIFENEYNVGEIISVNDFRGTVIEIGIRSTKILDLAGNIKIVNNSDIKDVINLSRELSLAVVHCDFPYDVPVELIENLIEKELPKMAKEIPGIVEGPFYKGISEYKDSNCTLMLLARCKENDRFQIERDINRMYRAMLVRNGIDIAYPQVVLNYAEKKDYDESNQKKANKFVDKQREMAQNYEEQEQ